MSFKVSQFHRVETSVLFQYKTYILTKLEQPVVSGTHRKELFERLDAVDCELNKRYNEMYNKSNRNAEYERYFAQNLKNLTK